MAIPDFQTVMLPVLEFLADGQEHHIREIIDSISRRYELTEQEKNQVLSSGRQPVIDNRVGWAKTYMLKAGLIESPRRGYAKIKPEGIRVLQQKPSRIDIHFLEKYPEFIEFRTIKRERSLEDVTIDTEIEQEKEDRTPDELMESGYNSILASLGVDILSSIRSNTPAFFEKVVLDLLSSMGYGEGKVTGRSGDGGIDGFISQDKLGLDKIMFQAKRYGEGTTVKAGDIRDFVGALDLNKVNKGVFVTTSKFAGDANDIVKKSQKSIVLIDGSKLVKLMIDFNIGVSREKNYEIKRMDTDYFAEE